MLFDRTLADTEILDLLHRIIEEKEVPLSPSSYRRLITAIADALCHEFSCTIELVSTCDDDDVGATIHLTDVEADSIWFEYGDDDTFFLKNV